MHLLDDKRVPIACLAGNKISCVAASCAVNNTVFEMPGKGRFASEKQISTSGEKLGGVCIWHKNCL
jgi:hypothetical protein